MTTYASGLGISIKVSTPLVTGGKVVPTFEEWAIKSYSHRVAGVGGYDTASIEIGGLYSSMEEWLSAGLGRHIEVFNEANELIWEGFVNQINLNAGGVSIQHGPLLDIANRVFVMYTPILDPTTDPPILGVRTETTLANDTTSQERYGIIEKALNGGNMLDDGTTDDAEYVRNRYLRRSANPRTTKEISLGGGGEPSVSLDCKGYFHWLNAYVFNDGDFPYSITCTSKLQNILGEDPNGLFSTDYGLIESNPVLTTGLEDQNRTAMTVVQEILTLGDANDNRWIFGFYQERKAAYAAIPTSVEYNYYIMSENNLVTSMTDAVIHPWNVKPGKWAIIRDLLVGRKTEYDAYGLGDDPRLIFIDAVEFSAPYGVNLRYGETDTFPQMMARMGYGGIS